MQLVFSPLICPELRLPEALDFARKAGFARIELFRTCTESRPVHPDFSVRGVREHLQRAGVALSGLNIRALTGRKADSDERNLQYNLRQLEWDIHLARALGLKSVNLEGGARSGEARADLTEGIEQLLERIPDISLNLGNRKGSCLQGLADFQALVPHLGERARVLLHTGELLAAGEDVLRFAAAFAGRLGRVHLRDQRGEKPAPFGEGELPLAELLARLREAGYGGDLVLELEKAEGREALQSAVEARRYLEKLLAGPNLATC